MKKAVIASLLTLLFCGSDDTAVTTPTTFDTTFGSSGVVQTTMGSGQSQVTKILVESSTDKIYAIGWLMSGGTQLAVARYSKDGVLDTTFGSSGKLVTNFSGFGFEASDAVFDSSGNIYISGTSGTSTGGNGNNFAIAKITSSGTVDTTFDSDGLATFDTATVTSVTAFSTDYGTGLARRGDGALYIAAHTNVSNSGTLTQALAGLLTSAGALNTAFSSDGLAVQALGSTKNDLTRAIASDSSNRALLAGSVYNGSNYDFFVARFTSVGALDTTFGTSGKTLVDVSSDDYLQQMVLQSDGSILLLGYTGSSPRSLTIAKLKSDGSLDASFGSSGKVSYSMNYSDTISETKRIADMVVDTSGRIYIGGYHSISDTSKMSIMRFTSAGVLDTSFGNSGISSAPSGTTVGQVQALAIQSSGKVIAGGNIGANSDRHFTLSRFSP